MKISPAALLGLCCSTTAFMPVRPLRMATSSAAGRMFSTPPVKEGSSTASVKKEDRLSTQQTDEFQNDGLFSWLGMYLNMLGMEEGKVPKFGFLASAPDVDTEPTTSDAAAARREAIDNMANISAQERQRRDELGDVAIRLTAAYAVIASLFLDDGSFGGHLVRFSIVVPIFLALGYKSSAETGLWNVAQQGLWDIDGRGLTKIDDPSLAKKFLDKVNAYNLESILNSAGLAAVFAALPQSATQPAAISAVILTILYYIQDKIPAEIE